MSHLLESYSLQTGAKISKPFIIKHFYPTPERYITIHNSSGMGSKNYDYFQEVVDEISEILASKNISIVQIGTSEDPLLNGCINIQGRTNYHQTAYIISKSLLHIGNDSFPVHLASASDIPIIALYSITTPEIAGPFFSKNKNVFCFEPNEKLKKPSFNPNENPKTVNSIKIEDIVNKTFEILDIKNDLELESLFIGKEYKNKIIEYVPDSVLNSNIENGTMVNIRVDLLNKEVNEQLIFNFLSSLKCNIVINNKKKIQNIEILRQLSPNIANLIFDVGDDIDIDTKYIKSLSNIGIHPIILYKGNNKEAFDNIKLSLIDTNLRFIHDKVEEKDFDKLNKIDSNINDDTWLKSNRLILSNQQVFLSKAHLQKGKNTTSKSQKLELENIKLLAEDLKYIYLYKKNKKNAQN